MEIKRYNNKLEPNEVVSKLPFWWFTDIIIAFFKKSKKKAIAYEIHPNKMVPIENPYKDLRITAQIIPYDQKEYPENRFFDNFPPEQGSPFYKGIEELLKSHESSMKDIYGIFAMIRYHSLGSGEQHALTLHYKRENGKVSFERKILEDSLMDYLNNGGVEYLDKVFDKSTPQ